MRTSICKPRGVFRCKHVFGKLLITSRERLNLRDEWVFVVEGFPVPDAPEVAEHLDAVKLFLQRAKRVRLDFSLQGNLLHILRICKFVDGLPLGIELAAAWVRLMTPEEIASEIEQNLDLLQSTERDVGERQQSIRATFEYSWKLISAKEQEVLAKLSVFVGGFTREAAAQVAGASIPVLASLADKSLVRLLPNSRYDRHPLPYRYTQEKLAEHPHEEAQAQEAHGLYYLRFVRERAGRLRTRDHKQAIEAIDEELDNIRAAWRWAVRERKLEALEETAPALSRAYSHRDKEGVEVFAHAVSGLDEGNPAHHAALGYSLVAQAEHEHWLGSRPEQARDLAERGLSLLRPLGEVQGMLRGLLVVQRTSWLAGEFAQARALAEEGLELARQHGSASDIGDFLVRLGRVKRDFEDVTTLRPYYEEVLAELRELDDLFNVARYLFIFGSCLVNYLLLREGQGLLRESVQLAREVDDRRVLPYALIELARASYHLRAYEQAAALAGEALTVVKESGDANAEALALSMLGRVANALGDYQGAQAYLLQSLELSRVNQQVINTPLILLWLAEHLAAQGQLERAAELASLVLHHPVTEKPDKAEAGRLLDTLRGQLSSLAFAQANERAQALTLDEVVASLLAGFGVFIVAEKVWSFVQFAAPGGAILASL